MSEEEYDEIPPLDIQIEILKRVPIKSLLQFRSVSKTWKSIIDSSQFITDYNTSYIQHHQFFVGYGYGYAHHVDIYNDANDISFIQRLTLNMSAEHPDMQVCNLISHSHGLFGFHCYNKKTSKDVAVIWNPSLRKSVVIPAPPDSKTRTNNVDFGFTVCNATDPTILMITYTLWNKVEMIEIFELSTRVWRTLSCTPPRGSIEFETMVMIDRFVHWTASDWTPEGVCLDNLILSFDIDTEQFTELSVPPTLAHTSLADSDSDLELYKLRESLVVLQYHDHQHEVDVWMMMEARAQKSFSKLYNVKPPYTMSRVNVIGFRKNGQPIIKVASDTNDRWTLLFCDPERFNEVPISIHGYIAGSYMKTLLLLDH